ncbi:PucR family transcriptional regulator [Streptomyces sp. HM190]|uniref:PucR family transcriptional regulator n=1 Tax=Streptomyces sp. HM190 TaxID=2695266 RepID=UPI001357E863|nr:PucR family transcriptional regulator [Streptomyces sp. HM190]
MSELTVNWLYRQPGLGLSVVAGKAGLGRSVHSVHTSEQPDPTPWLEPDQLLLTTGMWLEAADPQAADAYVRRLHEARAAGLGFGVGIRYEDVPRPLVEAADEVGLPVLTVPEATPFSLLQRAVWRSTVRDEQQALRGSLRASESLLAAAADGAGPRLLLERISAALGADAGWVDVDGRVLAWSSPDGEDFGTWLAGHHVGRGAAEGWQAAVRDTGRQRVLVLPVVVGRTSCGELVIRRSTAFTAHDQHVIRTAVLLLAMNADHERQTLWARLDVRSALLGTALSGHYDLAVRLGYETGLDLPRFPLRVTVVHGGSDLVDLLERCEARVPAGSRQFTALRDDRCLVVLAEQNAWSPTWTAEQLKADHSLTAASAVAFQSTSLAEVLARTSTAARSAEPGRLVDLEANFDHAYIPLTHDSAHVAWATGLLGPLLALPDRQQSSALHTLRAWLANNGNGEATARDLAVHRNTLRWRLERIRTLLQGDLDDADLRAGLWLAIRTLGIDAVGASSPR